MDNLYVDDRLLRSWREGQAKHNAYLEDYAGLIHALLALYQSDPNSGWYAAALKLGDEMAAHFADAKGGFFDTRDDHETLLLRPKDIQDNATPSGNSLAATDLLKLAAYGDRNDWHSVAEGMLGSIQNAMLRYPTAFGQWLCAADFAVGPIHEVSIIGDSDDSKTHELLKVLWKSFRPRQVTAISAYPRSRDHQHYLKTAHCSTGSQPRMSARGSFAFNLLILLLKWRVNLQEIRANERYCYAARSIKRAENTIPLVRLGTLYE